jgi:hypothetical protein
VAVAYFVLKTGATYEWRSKKSGFLYAFSGSTPKRVVDPGDQVRFRGMTDVFVETDETGRIIDSSTGQTVPMSFSRKGMVGPKSYTKLSAPPPPPPAPAAQPAPRTVTSSTKAEEPAAPPKVAPAPTTAPAPVAAESDKSADKDTGKAGMATADAPDSKDGSLESDVASEDSGPTKRTKKSSRKKKSGRKGDS